MITKFAEKLRNEPDRYEDTIIGHKHLADWQKRLLYDEYGLIFGLTTGLGSAWVGSEFARPKKGNTVLKALAAGAALGSAAGFYTGVKGSEKGLRKQRALARDRRNASKEQTGAEVKTAGDTSEDTDTYERPSLLAGMALGAGIGAIPGLLRVRKWLRGTKRVPVYEDIDILKNLFSKTPAGEAIRRAIRRQTFAGTLIGAGTGLFAQRLRDIYNGEY